MANDLINSHNSTSTAGTDDRDQTALLPHLESLEKMMKLPVVEAAWQQSQDVYGKVKGTFY